MKNPKIPQIIEKLANATKNKEKTKVIIKIYLINLEIERNSKIKRLATAISPAKIPRELNVPTKFPTLSPMIPKERAVGTNKWII